MRMHYKIMVGAVLASLAVAGCGGGQSSVSPSIPSTMGQNQVHNQGAGPAGGGVLGQLRHQTVIGSTIDSQYGQLNPYGLDVAKTTNGAFTKGDLAVCNFNDNTNTQGTGYTVVALHPKPGAAPLLVVADPTNLVGCNALALTHNDTIWAAAFVSNGNPWYTAAGAFIATFTGSPFNHPFGQIWAQPRQGPQAIYESNAGDGSIVRINLHTFSTEVIATGFPINGGPPGSILGPSGLQYQRNSDTLYVVDGQNNSVTAISKVTTLHSGCLTVLASGTRFGGACKSRARVLYSGAPLNGPISSALFFNGNIVVGNTLDPSGENLMVEINPSGRVMNVRNVDTGASGSLFGMVATGNNAANTKLYFNDDNDNNLQVLER